MGLLEIASVSLSQAQARVETAAQNIANVSTPGFKAHRRFAELVGASPVDTGGDDGSVVVSSLDFSSGKLRLTGNPFDLAVSGSGFFTVGSGDAVRYTRDGQFHQDQDGRLVTANGLTLQSDGGDVIVGDQGLKVLADGTILDGTQPSGRLTIADFADPQVLRPAGDGLFAAPSDVDATEATGAQIQQGALETSNVETSDEMISLMAAMRGAEAGQHLVQVYDDLMGQALTAFGGQS